MDRFFNRALDQLERTLGRGMREAQEPADLDRLLADEPWRALKLSSAATFRRQGSFLVRDEDGRGWEGCATRELDLEQPMLAPVSTGLPLGSRKRMTTRSISRGSRRPVLAVPAADPVRCCPVALWSACCRHRSRRKRTCDAFPSCPLRRRYVRGARSGELRHRIATLKRKLKAPSRRLR